MAIFMALSATLRSKNRIATNWSCWRPAWVIPMMWLWLRRRNRLSFQDRASCMWMRLLNDWLDIHPKRRSAIPRGCCKDPKPIQWPCIKFAMHYLNGRVCAWRCSITPRTVGSFGWNWIYPRLPMSTVGIPIGSRFNATLPSVKWPLSRSANSLSRSIKVWKASSWPIWRVESNTSTKVLFKVPAITARR